MKQEMDTNPLTEPPDSDLGDPRVRNHGPPVEEDERVQLDGGPPGHLRVVVPLVEVVAAGPQAVPGQKDRVRQGKAGATGM